MITVGCAGFAVPATRYFKEYGFVEIQETHRAVPGPGTIRRWRREAPNDFQFAVLGPREVAQEGFRSGKVIETALVGLLEVAGELEAKPLLCRSAGFAETRPNAALPLVLAKTVRRGRIQPGLDWDADREEQRNETGTSRRAIRCATAGRSARSRITDCQPRRPQVALRRSRHRASG
jgi:hypothetical protein